MKEKARRKNVSELRLLDDDVSDDLKPSESAGPLSIEDEAIKVPDKQSGKGLLNMSQQSKGSVFTINEEADEIEDYKLPAKEDFIDNHEKIMIITRQIDDLTGEFFKAANSRAVELEGIGKD